MGDLDGLFPDIIEKDKKEEKQIERWVATTAMILGVVFVLVVTLGVLLLYPAWRVDVEKVTQTHEEPYQETVLESKELSVLYDEIFANKSEYSNREATLIGFLQKRELERGRVEYAVLDDYGKRIEVRALTDEQKALFPLEKKTANLYELEGRFFVDYSTIRFDAKSVFVTTRPLSETIYNVTRTRSSTTQSYTYELVQISMLQHLIGKIGTGPAPQSCADASAIGACSTQKPYYCDLHGRLLVAAGRCGCPDGMTRNADLCVGGGS